jgi:hypothetical protein
MANALVQHIRVSGAEEALNSVNTRQLGAIGKLRLGGHSGSIHHFDICPEVLYKAKQTALPIPHASGGARQLGCSANSP